MAAFLAWVYLTSQSSAGDGTDSQYTDGSTPAAAAAGATATSTQGLTLIQQMEGYSPTAYSDAGGQGDSLIGYGHQITSADTIGSSIDPVTGEQLLESDVGGVDSAINSLVTQPLTQGQYDALSDFVYNEGASAFANSTLLQDLNAGNVSGAAQEFSRWIYAGGSVLPALVTRRAADQSVFGS